MLSLSINDPKYPKLLRKIKNPPETLYYRGDLETLAYSDSVNLAIVGSRKMSAYGQQCVEYFLNALVDYNITIISGLAFGIDSHAHATALAMGLKTIAVLGGAADDDSIYPKEHLGLARKIINSSGTIISEYPAGTAGRKGYFIQRNRIIAGLSHAVIIIEATEQSGSLTTAQFALKEQREVFAAPNDIFNNQAKGSNALLKTGAQAITSGSDIINKYQLKMKSGKNVNNPETPGFKNLSQKEQRIYSCIQVKPVNIKELLEKSGLSISELNAALALLEINNKIKNFGNGNFARYLTSED